MTTLTTDKLLKKLKIQVRDTGNQNWSEPEMLDAIEDALIDPAFCDLIEDEITVGSAQDYEIPDTIDVVEDVYVTIDGKKIKIPGVNWDQIGVTLRFYNTPSITGVYVLTGYKQNYAEVPKEKVNLAIYLAIIKLYEMVEHEFATGILMSDITGAEIGNILDRFERKIVQERTKIGRVTNRRGYSI